ncbi:MAG: hypothetical protein ACO1SV_04590 [Fimbriimonas sp.]
MFGGKARQYPNLVSYLHHASRQPERVAGRLPLSTAVGLTSGWGVFAIGATLLHQPALAVPAAFLTFGMGVLYSRTNRPAPSPRDRRREEAREVGDIMRRCLDLRRLHRDLDEGSLTLLEECSRHWARIYGVFGSGFWSDEHLPTAYAAAREQALNAADEAMEDVLILYRPCLPAEVKGRMAIDYVEEALEQYVFKGQTGVGPSPAAFGPARQIAEKLRDLANEAERIASDLHRERVTAPTGVSGSLEASLGELRAIRQAEDELRQNLRG